MLAVCDRLADLGHRSYSVQQRGPGDEGQPDDVGLSKGQGNEAQLMASRRGPGQVSRCLEQSERTVIGLTSDAARWRPLRDAAQAARMSVTLPMSV